MCVRRQMLPLAMVSCGYLMPSLATRRIGRACCGRRSLRRVDLARRTGNCGQQETYSSHFRRHLGSGERNLLPLSPAGSWVGRRTGSDEISLTPAPGRRSCSDQGEGGWGRNRFDVRTLTCFFLQGMHPLLDFVCDFLCIIARSCSRTL